MKKRLVLLLTLIVGLLALAIPTVVFAHQQSVSQTVFYACENNQGGIDPNSITQNDGILQSGSCVGSNVVVKWSVTGPQGIQGIKGDTGTVGPQGNTGPAGLQGLQGDTGANGSNILTSDSAPTGGCISGDSDIDLSTDEVYSCAASTWVDTNHTVKGDKGDPGLQGTQGPKGDTGQPGQDGANGTNGLSILTSSDVPADVCITGNTDIDLANGEVYSCVALDWTDTGHTVKGDKGDPGTNGTNGQDGKPGIPFSHAACSEKLSGSAQQENRIFCQSGIEADGGLVYTAAINAAKVRILVGTPISTFPNVDWGGVAVTYVEFTSGFHMEYHADNIVRVYNTLNQRVF